MSIDCELAGQCSGCSLIGIPYATQLEKKKEAYQKAATRLGVRVPETLEITSAGEQGLRDRVDFSFRRDPQSGVARFGLYDLVSRKDLLDITRCPQLSPELNGWLELFRAALPPILEKGSFRLRIAPDGSRGAWLDLANLDVKQLLEERIWLERQHELASLVELGQRFKPLVREERSGALRLAKAPEPRAWFETYLGDQLTPSPLFGCVGSFTQPGFKANRVLISSVRELATDLSGARVLELFSGLGNFSLPLASWGMQVTAFEVEETAVLSFEKSLEAAPAEFAKRVTLSQKNLYSSSAELPKLSGYDVLFVDPPRSGLREVANLIETTPAFRRPKTMLYVSCFAESMLKDLKQLEQAGYVLKRVVGVDQFPQSEHCEWIARLELK